MELKPGRSPRAACLLYSHYQSDPRPRREAEALRDAGWEVTVFSLGKPGEPPRADAEGVTVVTYPMSRYRGESMGGYLTAYLKFTLWAAGKMIRQGRKFDLVHVHTPPDFLAFASLPARWAGARTLLDVHDVTPELFMERFGNRRTFVVRSAELVERWSGGVMHGVVTVNEQLRLILAARGIPAEKITVTLNVPEEKIFWRETPLEFPDRPVLAYHGTLVPHFGPGVLLEAAARLVPRYPDMTVKILGDGDMKPELEARAARPDLAGKVYISPERVPVHRIPEELGAVTAGAVPNRAEGFPKLVLPTKLLEYVAMGIPTVVTGTEAIQHYFEPDELITVSRPDPDEFAGALARIIDNPEMAREQVRKARRFFDRHSWKIEKQAFVERVSRLAGIENGAPR